MKARTIAAGIGTATLAVALAVVLPGQALAGPPSVKGITTQTVVTTVGVIPNSTGEADATCGAGELLLSGGYTVSAASSDWAVYLDAPTTASTWTVEIVNLDPSQSLSYSAYAVCAVSLPGKNALSGYTTHLVSANVNAPSPSNSEADAACAAGQLLVGGGYEVDNVSLNWSAYVNGPLNASTWFVEIDNESGADTMFHAFAICLARTNNKAITGLTESTSATNSSAPAADASCGAKTLMTGGGYQIHSIGQEWRNAEDFPVSATTWRVGLTDLDSFSRVYDTFAVCLAKA